MVGTTCHCLRCEEDVNPVYRQPRLRKLARYYFFLPIPFAPFIPIIGSDYIVMIPLSMVYMLGIGPALALVSEKPTCGSCGAFVQPLET